MFDFLNKFKKEWNPENILTDNSPDISFVSDNLTDHEELALAQRLADHLNEIIDYKNRLDSIDYLSNQAKSNFDNITYVASDESMVNAISAIGGSNGTVDFFLVCDAIRLVLEFIDQTALEALTGQI